MSPPGTFGQPRSPGGARWVKPLCIGAIALLGAVAIAVVFVLPEVLRPPGAPATSADVSPTPPPKSPKPAETAAPAPVPPAGDGAAVRSPDAPATPPPPVPADKAEADRARGDALRLQAGLENAGARDWAKTRFETSYPDALAALDRANADYDRSAYTDAARLYDAAAVLLRTLEKNRPERLRRALASAEDALRIFDPDTAETRFGEALVLDPGNAEAIAGQRRAANLRRAMELTMTAGKLLAADRLEDAAAAFADAVAADPAYPPAARGLQETRRELARRRFVSRMSSAAVALDAGRFQEAGRALDEAAKIHPDDPSVRDMKLRLAVARQNAALRALRAEIEKHEAAEAWSDAVAAYERALAVDANAAFAVEGLARARRFVELHGQVDFYLARPERLQSGQPLTHAASVLEAAREVRAPGERLKDKRDRLAALLAAATVPVGVTLVSDGKTSVTVFRVARMGTFAERRVELVPGSYVAVGTRVGFRDVRVTFTVPLRSSGVTVTVRCEEPI